jgi:predicted transcriptional regulator
MPASFEDSYSNPVPDRLLKPTPGVASMLWSHFSGSVPIFPDPCHRFPNAPQFPERPTASRPLRANPLPSRKFFLELLGTLGNISYLRQMKRKEQPEPTRSELEILQVLWQDGPNTVRFVNDRLNQQKREVNYASTLKLMQIMVEKGLLQRDESQVKHVYSAATEEGKTKSLLLDRFVESLFNGSVSSLMLHLVDNKKASARELEDIRKLLNRSKGKE